ncbi:hypothetical protein V6N13_111159 [Hibiscus sabdariffa]
MECFYANGKPFIISREARARVLRVPRLERPRQQRGPRPTGTSTGSTHQTGGPSTAAGPGVAVEGSSAEPYTPMSPFFSHASSSQFHSPYTPMPPPTEGFFTGAFQPYSSMMTAPYTPMPPHQMHTLVAPLSVYSPQHPDFGSSYGMVHHTPTGSLFATGPSGSGHHADDESEEDDDEAMHLFEEIPQESSCTRLWDRGT